MSKHICAAVAVVCAIAATGVAGVVSAPAALPTRSLETSTPRQSVVEGPTVAGVKVTGTQGGARGSLYTWAACEQWAEKANEAIEAGYTALFDGNMAGASEKFGEAVKYINEGESAGCIFG